MAGPRNPMSPSPPMPMSDSLEHAAEIKGELKSCMSSSNLQTMETASSFNRQRSVSFHNIEIREYERTIGDHPCVRGGPPVSLGWRYAPDSIVFNLEEYEAGQIPRAKEQMIMPRHLREHVLKDAGVSRREMAEATKIAFETQDQRNTTASHTALRDKTDYALECAGRKLKYVFQPSKKSEMKRTMSLCDVNQKSVETLPLKSEPHKSKAFTSRLLSSIRSRSCNNLQSQEAEPTKKVLPMNTSLPKKAVPSRSCNNLQSQEAELTKKEVPTSLPKKAVPTSLPKPVETASEPEKEKSSAMGTTSSEECKVEDGDDWFVAEIEKDNQEDLAQGLFII
jgi:hypothetical protein